jgi:hypothetical protein
MTTSDRTVHNGTPASATRVSGTRGHAVLVAVQDGLAWLFGEPWPNRTRRTGRHREASGEVNDGDR